MIALWIEMRPIGLWPRYHFIKCAQRKLIRHLATEAPNMTPDPKWIDALKLPLPVFFALALATSMLLGLNLTGFLDIGPVKDYVRPLLIIVTVGLWSLVIVLTGNELLKPIFEKRKISALETRRAVRRKEEEAEAAEERARVLERLDHLSMEETTYVADCLRKGTPSFFTYVHHGPVTLLCGKKLAWTPGGEHHQDHYPFMFRDFVWKAMLSRKDEFVAKDDEFKRQAAAEKAAQARRRAY